jgi:O-methyltransferase
MLLRRVCARDRPDLCATRSRGYLPAVWKDRINAALAKTTGYQVQRVRAGAPRTGNKPRPRATERPPATWTPPAAVRKKAAPPRKGKVHEIPGHYDEAAKRLIQRVKPRTMTTPEKLYGLIQATRYVSAHDIPGDVVECGVWRGGSMQTVAYTLLEAGESERDLHLFDTFEGMPENPSDIDRRTFAGGETAAELLAASDRSAKIWAYAPFEDVRSAMDETGYPTERIHYHRGLVEETVPREAPERISILRLDTDWYESTRHELEHLYDRLSPGGVLIIDDYGGWAGSRKATDEFLDKTRAPLLLLPISGGRIAVKPGPGVGATSAP